MRMTWLWIVFFSFSFTWKNNPAPPSEVEIEISNIKSTRGVFVISFYNDENMFPKPGKEMLIEKITVKDTLARKVKIKLPHPGWYAMAMFQDEDENGKIKQDKIGVPLEAYAFSNNIHPQTKAPSFSECKFLVGESAHPSLAIRLIQPLFIRRR